MKKQISLIIVFCMLLSMLPCVAYAQTAARVEGYKIYRELTNAQLEDENNLVENTEAIKACYIGDNYIEAHISADAQEDIRLITAVYNSNGTLDKVTMKEGTVTDLWYPKMTVNVTAEDVGKNLKVFAWGGENKMQPLSGEVFNSIALLENADDPIPTDEPTTKPTDKPTDEPTTEPTATPTVKPTELPEEVEAEKIGLASMFTDNMLVQREQDITLWGRLDNSIAAESVTVTMLDAVTGEIKASDEITPDSNNKNEWKANLGKHTYVKGESYVIIFEAKKDGDVAARKIIKDILLGDVYLCSGQSNMEYAMNYYGGAGGWTDCWTDLYTDPSKVKTNVAGNDKIGHTHVELDTENGGEYSDKLKNDNIRIIKNLNQSGGETNYSTVTEGWKKANAQNLENFSATATYFGFALEEEKDVPIGLILSAVGGSSINAWGTRNTTDADENVIFNVNSGLYNREISAYTHGPVGLSGIIWYQGCADAYFEDLGAYTKTMENLVDDYREKFNQPDLPFMYVQLAAYVGGEYAPMREAQLNYYLGKNTSKRPSNVGMAVITDNTDGIQDIHPRGKKEVGRRLSLLARKLVYGENITAMGPIFKEAVVDKNEGTITLTFEEDTIGSGIELVDNKLVGMQIATASRQKFVEPEWELSADKKSIILKAPEGSLPTYPSVVRYGYYKLPTDASIRNSEGLPASAFRNYSGSDPTTPDPIVEKELTASNINPESVTLYWGPSNVEVTDIDHYDVYRNDVKISSVGALSTVDKTVEAGETYTYKLKAINAAGGVLKESTAVDVTVPADTALTASVSNGVISAEGMTVSGGTVSSYAETPAIKLTGTEKININIPTDSEELFVNGADITYTYITDSALERKVLVTKYDDTVINGEYICPMGTELTYWKRITVPVENVEFNTDGNGADFVITSDQVNNHSVYIKDITVTPKYEGSNAYIKAGSDGNSVDLHYTSWFPKAQVETESKTGINAWTWSENSWNNIWISPEYMKTEKSAAAAFMTTYYDTPDSDTATVAASGMTFAPVTTKTGEWITNVIQKDDFVNSSPISPSAYNDNYALQIFGNVSGAVVGEMAIYNESKYIPASLEMLNTTIHRTMMDYDRSTGVEVVKTAAGNSKYFAVPANGSMKISVDKNYIGEADNAVTVNIDYIASATAKLSYTAQNGYTKEIVIAAGGTETAPAQITLHLKDYSNKNGITVTAGESKINIARISVNNDAKLSSVIEKPVKIDTAAAIKTTDDMLYSDAYAEMPYRYYLPEGYDENDTETTYPLLMYLHGAGRRGTDNKNQLVNPKPLIDELLTAEYQEKYPCIIVVPQCPEGKQWVDLSWGNGSYVLNNVQKSEAMGMAENILNKFKTDYNIDEDRIYLAGQSMGGYGTWDMALRNPDMFAAIIPMCGAGAPTSAEFLADNNTAIWAFHGEKDATVPLKGSRDMITALREAGSTNVRYSQYPEADHEVQVKAFEDENLIPWLFSKSKSTNENENDTYTHIAMDGKLLTTGPRPIETDGKTAIPAKFILERAGLTATYEDNILTCSDGTTTVVITKDSTTAKVNESDVTMDISPFEQDGYLMTSTDIFNVFGFRFLWDDVSRTVTVKHNAQRDGSLEIIAVTGVNAELANPAENAIDGKTDTRWSALKANPIIFDLGETKLISSVSALFYEGSNREYTFDIEVSTDNQNWTKVVTGGKSNKTGAYEDFDFNPVSARYVKYDGSENALDYSSLYEFEIYPASEITIVGAEASNYQDGADASKAIDGNLDTRWAALVTPQRLTNTYTFDIGGVGEVNGVSLCFYCGTSRIYDFDLDYSTDGETWTEIGTFESSGRAVDNNLTTTGNANGFETFGFDTVKARYIRYTGRGQKGVISGGGSASYNTFWEGKILGNPDSVTRESSVELASMFTDNMVIQRNEPINLWGKAAAGSQVKVDFVEVSGDEENVITSQTVNVADGMWTVSLDAQEYAAGKEYKINTYEIADGKTLPGVSLNDILLGDVYLCSGQSNMAYGVNDQNGNLVFSDYQEDISNGKMDNDNIRLIKNAPDSTKDKEYETTNNGWQKATTETLTDFSAVGAYFGAKLYEDHGVPIGLVESALGSTAIAYWMPTPFNDENGNAYSWINGNSEETPFGDEGLYFKNATKAYTKIDGKHGAVKFAGMIWYQGEYDAAKGMLGNEQLYTKAMENLVNGYREVLDRPNLPFMYVQLAQYKQTDHSKIRQAQLDYYRGVNTVNGKPQNVGMAVITDIGLDDYSINNIHPLGKNQVAQRLALIADKLVYNENKTVMGPVINGVTYKEDEGHYCLELTFDADTIGEGLKVKDETLKGMVISDADGSSDTSPKYKIEDNKLIVWSETLGTHPVTASYGYSAAPGEITLMNTDNLPASPFTISAEDVPEDSAVVEFDIISATADKQSDEAYKAIDGDLTTNYNSNYIGDEGSSSYITFDLGEERTVTGVKLAFFRAYQGRIYSFDLQYYDENENSWKTINGTEHLSSYGNNGGQDTETGATENSFDRFSFAPVTARYIRYVGYGCTSDATYSGYNVLWEAKILGYGYDDGEAAEGPAITSAQSNTDGVALAWDSVEGAQNYKIYRDDEFIGMADTNSYNDTDFDVSSTHQYQIKAILENDAETKKGEKYSVETVKGAQISVKNFGIYMINCAKQQDFSYDAEKNCLKFNHYAYLGFDLSKALDSTVNNVKIRVTYEGTGVSNDIGVQYSTQETPQFGGSANLSSGQTGWCTKEVEIDDIYNTNGLTSGGMDVRFTWGNVTTDYQTDRYIKKIQVIDMTEETNTSEEPNG